MRIRKGHEWETAFKTRYSHFEYLVMPFKLANALATFQAYVNTALISFLDHFVVVYLDNILIYSRNKEEYYEHVRQVLTKLRKNNLFCKLSKCKFNIKKVEFLGFFVGTEGVYANFERIRSVIKWPRPNSFHDIQVFLGFANFYRRFIYYYFQVTLGLINLLKK